MNLEYESFKNNLENKYSYFQSKIIYKRIWSSVNYFHVEFHNLLDTLKSTTSTNNNYTYIKIENKSALSRKFIIDLFLKPNFDVNKKKWFILSGGFNFLFNFKSFNIQSGYKHEYKYTDYFNNIYKNNFYKFGSNIFPYLNHKSYLMLFFNFIKFTTYSINF